MKSLPTERKVSERMNFHGSLDVNAGRRFRLVFIFQVMFLENSLEHLE